jgi:siroheme synthase
MAATDASFVKEVLMKAGMRADTPVAIAESVSSPQSALHAGTLADLPLLAARLRSGPALLLVGELFAALQAAANLDLAPRTASQSA